MNDKKADTIAGSFERFIQICGFKVHTILTDKGSEFTDRFARGKDEGPTGKHPMDQLCLIYGIKHKLTRPYRPQTNGMVERQRLSDAFKQVPVHNPNNSRTNHFADMSDVMDIFVNSSKIII